MACRFFVALTPGRSLNFQRPRRLTGSIGGRHQSSPGPGVSGGNFGLTVLLRLPWVRLPLAAAFFPPRLAICSSVVSDCFFLPCRPAAKSSPLVAQGVCVLRCFLWLARVLVLVAQWVCVLRCFLWLARVLALVAQCFLRFGPVSMAIERLARVLALVA